MIAWPRSLAGRLLAIAFVSTTAALIIAGIVLGGVLERFVMHGFDERLDTQVAILARAVRRDATLDTSRVVSLPQFDDRDSGWNWRVDGPGGRRWTNSENSLATGFLASPPPPHHAAGTRHPSPADGVDGHGVPIHVRLLVVATTAGPVRIMASSPRRIVEAPLREAMLPLLGLLALLGGVLVLATVVQLRFGLRPLRTIGAAVTAVRAGRQRRIAENQPVELQPLAVELNALIDQNEAGLANARRHVSNLAHGLKTPLAGLGLKLAEPGRDPDGELAAMLARIDRQIRHHLVRARTAVPGGGWRPRTVVVTPIADLVAVLARIHAERPVTAAIAVTDDLAVAVDPQDFDEMIGNLLDNAWRFAATRVIISARLDRASVIIDVDDDGPGLQGSELAEALLPGRRLDEASDGHGFGLSIARDLATVNGGSLILSAAAIGGLRVILTLPLA